MEQYRSGHNEADSKSVSLSRPVGSNPTCSAKQKALCLFRQRAFFAWKDLPSGVFPAYAPSPHLFCSGGRYPPASAPHPQPVNKAQDALPEIRRAVHHSRALPSDPLPIYIDACPSGTPQRNSAVFTEKIQKGYLCRYPYRASTEVTFLCSILRVMSLENLRNYRKQELLHHPVSKEQSFFLFRSSNFQLNQTQTGQDYLDTVK